MAQYELNLIDYWLIVKKRKYAIGVTAVLVLSFTVLLTELFKPTPVYEASARVKYDRTNTLASLLLESIATMGGSDLGTQSEVVRSFPVLEQAAKEMHLVPADTPDDGRRSAEYINAVYRLQQRTRALQEPNTNVIKITVAGETSEMAEQGANAVANAYRNQNIQERNRLVTLSRQYVEAQLVSLEQGLREAEDRLREFKEREGQVFLTEEAKAALDAFTKLEADYDKVLRLKNESQRQMEILAKHQTTAETAQERIFTEEPSAQLTVLNNRWLDLQQERANALIHYTPEHPLVKELDRKIDVVKRELARELESKLKSLTNREAALKEQIDLYR
ncbi:MAG TPA: Wzz/FepE/Etk N-terminal domain-containing protein, partial [Nitrospirales bacterium]|nr:Wzz/FepE/Etk N-terminal domain-containing protein [Nitrospirales bacterium]